MDDTTKLQRRTLEVKDATPDNLAPYGQILGPNAGEFIEIGDFYDGAVAVSRPVDFISDHDTCLTLASVQPRPLEIEYLERHFKHTQTFVPLGGKPFICVFGIPTDTDMPNLDTLQAFRFSGDTGICMHIGTWHEFPFALERDTNLIVILRNETNQNLSRGNVINNEAHGADLDKKNIRSRTGTIFEIKA